MSHITNEVSLQVEEAKLCIQFSTSRNFKVRAAKDHGKIFQSKPFLFAESSSPYFAK